MGEKLASLIREKNVLFVFFTQFIFLRIEELKFHLFVGLAGPECSRCGTNLIRMLG